MARAPGPTRLSRRGRCQWPWSACRSDRVQVSHCPALPVVRDGRWSARHGASARTHSQTCPATGTGRRAGSHIRRSGLFGPPVPSIAMGGSFTGPAVCDESLEVTATRPLRFGGVQSLDPAVLPLCPAGGGARVGVSPTRAGRKRAPGPRPAAEAASVISPPGPTRTLDTTPRPPPSRRNRASRHPRPDECPGPA